MARLVINGIPLLGEWSGVARYTFEIASRIAPTFETSYYYGQFSRRLITHPPAGFSKIKGIPLVKRVLRKGLSILSKLQSPHHFDLYFEPNFIPLPEIESSKVVVTIHDFSFHLHPQFHPAERVAYFKKHFWDRIGRADKIITVSQFVKREAVELLELPPEKVVPIYNGVEERFFAPISEGQLEEFRKKRGLPEKYLLFVGSIEPRKNLERLLRAYLSLPLSLRRDYPLLLAGGRGWNNQKIFQLIEDSGGDIRYLGYFPREEQPLLYRGAILFLYPSLYEGFGLPVLEGMAVGVPVLTSNTSALPEVGGDKVYYVDPLDQRQIGEGILELLENPHLREQLGKGGMERARQFSWEKSAKAHISLFLSLFPS
ncbi:MAG: glycosyltransferase family 1 protein [Campylobacterales bacterium]